MPTETTIVREAVKINGDIPARDLTIWIYLLFFTSGIPAIIYQIVWQRALFALYGINIESVTIVVSAFMLGLGLGSLGGGVLSRSTRFSPVTFFGMAELGTAVFGSASLSIIHYVAEHTLRQPLWVTGTISFLLVVIPTTLMGATLPLLIEHLVRTTRNVGGSVGALYFVNTLGSGAACVVMIRPLMNGLGQTGAARCAALVNGIVGAGALIYSFLSGRAQQSLASSEENNARPGIATPFPFGLALFCAAFFGFVALSYEILWYRLLAFASEDRAPIFVSLLGSYLAGLAFGSRFAERYSEQHSPEAAILVLAFTALASAALGFLVGPLCAFLLKFLSPVSAGGWLPFFLFLLLVGHAAMLFGALFPLLAHASVSPNRAGTAASYLYTANIGGSTLGVLGVGFILMDRFSLYRIACVLLVGGILCAAAVLRSADRMSRLRKTGFAAGCVAAVSIALCSQSVFSTIYDRLLFKKFFPALHFAQVIENRSGTIAITPDGTVFGGGVYDGVFSTDLLNDHNFIVRPYSLSAFHSAPHRVLMIGLGSGSWAQVIANNPQVEAVTVVEINRGYLDAIPNHPQTASLLRNPKVTIVADDGRRWLLRNPEQKFDAILMNTSYNWRNHSSNLLSSGFLRIVRPHLNPNGVLFYNTTNSDDVAATGLSMFPYALRIYNCLALSDSPLKFDRARWRSVLLEYEIDGKRVIDPNDPAQMKMLDQIIAVPDSAPPVWDSIEENAQIRKRLHDRKNLIITDDNMGLEWK